MILNIKGPADSISTTIPVRGIVRLETCTLEFFGKKLYNLYIIVKGGEDENFHLFSYVSHSDFQAAYSSIANLLRKVPGNDSLIKVEPFSQKGRAYNPAVV